MSQLTPASKRRYPRFFLPWVICLAFTASALLLLVPILYANASPPSLIQPSPQPTDPAGRSWILRSTLAPGQTQADDGAVIYRLVCGTCHGFKGEGLRDNGSEGCWASKCHNGSFPPDGFEIPRFIPPVIGPQSLTRFRTALDLYEFNRKEMPWYSKGTMLDGEYWAVTAFLLRENRIDSGSQPLTREKAFAIVLHPQSAAVPSNTLSPSATPSNVPDSAEKGTSSSNGWVIPTILIVLGVLIVIRILFRRNRI